MIHILAVILIILYHLSSQFLGLDHLYVAQGLFFLLPGIISLYLNKQTHIVKKLEGRLILRTILEMLAVSLVAMSLVSATNYFFPIPEWILKMVPQDASFKNPYDIAFYALMPAVCEEFFFRGFYLNSLLKKYSPTFSIFTTTLVFSLAHLNPWYLPGLLLLGFYLSRLYTKEQNIWLCVMGHFLNNFVALVLMGFQ